jgi:putative stage III sporulation protein AH
MLEAKGFNNVIVSILNDKVDVVVERESLTETEIAQIEDIVTRKTDVPVTNLTITPVESRDK